MLCCCCYHKGTYFQANHNKLVGLCIVGLLLLLPQRYVFSSKSQPNSSSHDFKEVVVATTKVRIFKQITTLLRNRCRLHMLLLLPQRYVFSSKSQRIKVCNSFLIGCCCYHKGTYFQANHNLERAPFHTCLVVVATTKVRIFKQITTLGLAWLTILWLLLLPQRYVFSSKSQQN